MTRSKKIPKVLRATFASPILALNPPAFKVACDLIEDIESLSKCSSDLLSGAGSPLATAAGGTKGSWALILFFPLSPFCFFERFCSLLENDKGSRRLTARADGNHGKDVGAVLSGGTLSPRNADTSERVSRGY